MEEKYYPETEEDFIYQRGFKEGHKQALEEVEKWVNDEIKDLPQGLKSYRAVVKLQELKSKLKQEGGNSSQP